jgi:hypothetical protein
MGIRGVIIDPFRREVRAAEIESSLAQLQSIVRLGRERVFTGVVFGCTCPFRVAMESTNLAVGELRSIATFFGAALPGSLQ